MNLLSADTSVWKECIDLIAKGDLNAFKAFVEGSKLSINKRLGPLGMTLLHVCAALNQLKSAAWLLEKGARVNKKESSSGKTPLHLAAYFGHLEMVNLLLGHGAFSARATSFNPWDEALKDDAHCSPLHYAVLGQHLDLTKHLIEKGFNSNHFSMIGTPLDIAIRKGSVQLSDLISSNVGFDCIRCDEAIFPMRHFCSSVHLAIASRQEAIAKMLLNKFPQFPSKKLKKEWEHHDFSIALFSTLQNRDSPLSLFYALDKIQKINVQIKNSLKRNGSLRLYPPDSPLQTLFEAIEKGDLMSIQELISKRGKEVLSQSTEKDPWKEEGVDYLHLTPLRRAEQLYFFPLFDWLSEERIFPKALQELESFFFKWSFMEVLPQAGVFFPLILKEIDQAHP